MFSRWPYKTASSAIIHVIAGLIDCKELLPCETGLFDDLSEKTRADLLTSVNRNDDHAARLILHYNVRSFFASDDEPDLG